MVKTNGVVVQCELHKKPDKFGNCQYYPVGVESNEWPKCRPRHIAITAVILGICIALLVAYFLGAFNPKKTEELFPANPVKALPPSSSVLRTFRKAAVCADSPPCAEIGKGILEKNGSAVDAALGAMFCNGIVNMQSMGLGGGFLMTIYIRENKTAYTLNAREMAPLNSTPDMFKNDPEKSKTGPLSIGVPGELKGYWEAHQRFGVLPWRDVVQPTIDLCENGYNMSLHQSDNLQGIENDPNLREWFMEKDKFKKVGSVITPLKLCKTLRMVAENGGNDFYVGNLSKILVEDIKEFGGIITQEDLARYEAIWEEPISVKFRNEDHLYSMPLPGSGVLLGFILNILDGYNFTKDSIKDIDSTVLTYHRWIEAFKYAYAKRTELGDPTFVNITELLDNLTSTEYADKIRMKIKDNTTSSDPKEYGAVFMKQPEDHGTAHISVLAANGDAVSVTSTVNLYFGAKLTSRRTGVIFNSGMDDFSSPGFVSYYGLPGSPNNAIAPGKRSLSSKSPSIITDKNGDVRLVVGASGGTKITTAVAQIVMRSLWFDQNVKEAIDAPRLHHQLYPMEISYEYGNLQQIIDGLEALGHKTSRYTDRGSIVCALFMKNGTIYANADYRKGGDVFGLDV